MENLQENVSANKYLVSYRYVSSASKVESFSQDFKCVNNALTGDVNKNKTFTNREEESLSAQGSYPSQQPSSTKYILENVQSVLPSLSSKHPLSNGRAQQPVLKRFKHDCCELEEVNDAGLCSEEVSDLVMEKFPQEELAWLAKVVAQDHTYHQRRGVQFGGVKVWYFGRQQYSSSVPSQGDVSLGMDWTHSHSEDREIDTDTDSEEEQVESRRGKRKGRFKRLKPLSLSARLSLLRSHGILQIDRGESSDIERVQASRATQSGCSCSGPCLPQSCSCAVNQVQCEMDTEGFPCKCSQASCCNPHGRRVFNRKEVDRHRWTQVDGSSKTFLSPALSQNKKKLVNSR